MTTREPFSKPTFACDDMLGKLARDLRAIGYFAYYFRKIDDGKLVRFAADHGHILLTRDTLILPRRGLGAHLFIRSDFPSEQLAQVYQDLSLSVDPERFYTICLECNLPLTSLDREEVRGLVPPFVYEKQERFSHCCGCGKIFWPATHMEHMNRRLKEALALAEKGST